MIKLTDILNEVGEGTAGMYNVMGPLFDAGGTRYTKYKFKTKSGLRYDVVFYSTNKDVEVWFEAFGNVDLEDEWFSGDQLPMHKTTNRGELFKVMATTMGIIDHYLTAKGAGKPYGIDPEKTPLQIHAPGRNILRIEPTKKKKRGKDVKSDNRRLKLYMQYLKKQGYKASASGDTIKVNIKKFQ